MVYVFDDVVIDEDCWQIYRGNETVNAPPQVLAVLIYLIKHRNRIVTRHELLEEFWPKIYVSDGTLTRCLSRVREAIGQPRSESRPVTTIKRKGYRFVADVAVRPSIEGQASGVGQAPNTGTRTDLAEAERRLVLVLARTLSLLKYYAGVRSPTFEPIPETATDDLQSAIGQISGTEPGGTYLPFGPTSSAAAPAGRSNRDLSNGPEPPCPSVRARAQAAFDFEHPTRREDN